MGSSLLLARLPFRSQASAAVPVEANSAQPAYSSGGHDVELALAAFKKADPTMYKHLVDVHSPQLSTTKGLPTYTWQYVAKSSSGSATIRSVSVTLDPGGHIVGVSGGN
jgi:hypothetical protein